MSEFNLERIWKTSHNTKRHANSVDLKKLLNFFRQTYDRSQRYLYHSQKVPHKNKFTNLFFQFRINCNYTRHILQTFLAEIKTSKIKKIKPFIIQWNAKIDIKSQMSSSRLEFWKVWK